MSFVVIAMLSVDLPFHHLRDPKFPSTHQDRKFDLIRRGTSGEPDLPSLAGHRLNCPHLQHRVQPYINVVSVRLQEG